MERPDETEPREDDLPDKPAPPEVDTDDLADVEGEDVPDDEFLDRDQAREDPTVDDQEQDDPASDNTL